MRRLLLAALLTVALMGAAIAGNYVTTAPRLVNLLVEPFSLLLAPGFVVALALAGAHDYSPQTVVNTSAVFYFFFFFLALWWWEHNRKQASPR